MRKVQLVIVLAAAFLTGGLIANMDIAAEAANGNAEGGLKKLIARVTALEERVTALEENGPIPNADVKFVQLNDDAAGNAAGWNPGGGEASFLIADSDVKSNSIVTASIIEPNIAPGAYSETPCGVVFVFPDEGIGIGCPTRSEGEILNYMIVTPDS